MQQPAEIVAVGAYLKTQRRFASLRADDSEAIQARVDADREKQPVRAIEVRTLKY